MEKEAVYCLVITLFLFFAIVSAETGTVSIFVEMPPYEINVTSPLNTTYNFAKGANYTLALNTTTNFTVNAWWFTLYDLTHAETINNSVIFAPNTTFNAVRWSNHLRVYANDSDNRILNQNVTFFINVSNSAPALSIDSEIFGCEDAPLTYNFNATDADEDISEFTISPVSKFFVRRLSTSRTLFSAQIYSATMSPSDAATYQRNISVTDGVYSDSAQVNITIIEINDAPAITAIPTQTISTVGSPSSLYYQVQSSDEESGNQDGGKLSFNITFLSGAHLFNILQNGTMSYTPVAADAGNYLIQINVTDEALSSPHANISLCSQTGSNRSATATFQLTINATNTKPNINSYYPTSLAFSSPDTTTLNFNISTSDNEGTFPDAYWYVDSVKKEIDTLSLIHEFSHNFGCGVSGAHTVKVEITDGLLNESVQWNLTITNVACPTTSSGTTGGGGGGGGAAKKECEEKWACYDWQECKNAKTSFEINLLGEYDYAPIAEKCSQNNWNDDFCGFQVRECFDINSCDTTLNKPIQIQECYFTLNPSCSDGIKNCHDGSCEFLIDCGGPCPACPTCSDKIQNQGEENIDCGGPCPINCPLASPFIEKPLVKYTLISIIAVLSIIVILKFTRIFKIRKELKSVKNE